mmetsp:Transcript_15405/g.31582  ORF Transcript_15405/g.31582 Transcript_15405/m.31582 type:complete len:369 (-) Transcript_15405:203-1309(-)
MSDARSNSGDTESQQNGGEEIDKRMETLEHKPKELSTTVDSTMSDEGPNPSTEDTESHQNGGQIIDERMTKLEGQIRKLKNKMKNKMSVLEQRRQMKEEQDESQVFKPPDTYSFFDGDANRGILLGVFVFLCQFLGMSLLLSSIIVRSWNAASESNFDNPHFAENYESNFWYIIDPRNYKKNHGTFIPSQSSTLAKVTQFVSFIFFVIFRNETSADVLESTGNGCPKRFLWSSFLRGFIGLYGSLTTCIYIMSLSDAKDIFLSVTAVNYISGFDEKCFQMVQTGCFGPRLKQLADKINHGFSFLSSLGRSKMIPIRGRLNCFESNFIMILKITMVAIRYKTQQTMGDIIIRRTTSLRTTLFSDTAPHA